MTQDELDFLKKLCDVNGIYAVTKVIAYNASQCSAYFTNNGNDEAVIHKDAKHLNDAVELMKNSHPLRILRSIMDEQVDSL